MRWSIGPSDQAEESLAPLLLGHQWLSSFKLGSFTEKNIDKGMVEQGVIQPRRWI
jgi:hypothetical protein